MTTPVAIPHMRIVGAASVAAVAGYMLFSIWVFGWTQDAALKGDVIGTWKSFAVAAFAFWLGSSSGGKAVERKASGKPEDPASASQVEE